MMIILSKFKPLIVWLMYYIILFFLSPFPSLNQAWKLSTTKKIMQQGQKPGRGDNLHT